MIFNLNQQNNSNLMIKLCLIVMLPTVGLGMDIYSPSLPYITHFFHSTNAMIAESVSLYILGFALGQVFMGPLSDRYGRKPVLQSCLAVFSILSIAICYLNSVQLFLLLRFFQGLCVSGLAVAGRATISDCFSGDELRQVAAFVVTAWLSMPILAPAIGSYLQYIWGWHATFYFLAIYAGLILMLLLLFLPETNRARQHTSLVEIVQNYKHVMQSKRFMGLAFCIAMFFSIITICTISNPFYIESSLHYSVGEYGFIAVLLGVASLAGSISNRLFFKKYSYEFILSFCVGLSLCAVVCMLVYYAWVHLSLLGLVLPLLVILFSTGLAYPTLSAQTIQMFREKAGAAQAVRGVFSISLASMVNFLVANYALGSMLNIIVVYGIILLSIGIIITYQLRATTSTSI